MHFDQKTNGKVQQSHGKLKSQKIARQEREETQEVPLRVVVT